MPNFNQLPEKLILNPVQPVPLPKNYHFSVGFVPGWMPPNKDKIQLFFGQMTQGLALNTQDQASGSGFNRLLTDFLEHVAWHQLWGQQVPCTAVALANDGTYLARSNTRMLKPPIPPASFTNYRDLAFGPGDTPAPNAFVPPLGRRLYYRSEAMGGAPATLGRGWYIDAANRLEESDANRGFDRFSFWLSAFAVPPKNSCNVQTGEMLALKLNAALSRFVAKSTTMQAIGAAVNANLNGSTLPALMWTSTRVVVVHLLGQLNLTVFEFDLGGLRKQYWTDWLAAQDPNSVWSFRRLVQVPMPIWGMAGLA